MRLEVSSTAVHEFAQMVSKVLTAWQFPGDRHVSFDEETFDLKIDGKRRRDNGKGVRAITHAAFKVALLLHCRERNLPHPGFLVLDTPLLTYRDPLTSRYGELTGDEEEIALMSLKDHFFEHLAAESQGAQFIILENVDPPSQHREPCACRGLPRGSGAAGGSVFFPNVQACWFSPVEGDGLTPVLTS